VTQTPAQAHLNSHHRDTLAHIFRHPVSHNIEWRDVLSLLNAVATVQETHHGNFLVTLGTETETFEPPRHKDVDVGQVVVLRRILRSAGYEAIPDVPDGEAAIP